MSENKGPAKSAQKTGSDTFVSIFGQSNEHGDKFKAADEEADAIAKRKAEQAKDEEWQAKDEEWKDQVEKLEEEQEELEKQIALQEEVQRRKRELIQTGGPEEQDKVRQELTEGSQEIISLAVRRLKLKRKLDKLYENRGRASR